MSEFVPRMRSPRPAPESIDGRWRVGQTAPTDWSRALGLARKIPDGWYRAQSLATVAEHAPNSEVPGILNEAVQAANACHDEYGMIAVLAWPLEVAFKRGRISFALTERDRAITLAERIEPLASRAFALQCLWGCCYSAGSAYAEPVWQAILRFCPPDRSWRAARLYRHIAEVREHHEPGSGAAIAVIRAMPEGKARAKLARRLGLQADEQAPKALQ
jgi:hypothetical protein